MRCDQPKGSLADLIRQSEHMVCYSGAGISTAAGISDYATQAGKASLVNKGKSKHKGSRVLCEPTLSHYVLTRMHEKGYLKHWINQNHDGLPEKAGFPQARMNEIHGAWFDPSNPVVQFNESLRDDLFEELLRWEKKTDLCLVLGSSLCGMNADRIVESPSRRFVKKGKGHGVVIVNLQRTRYDEHVSIRIFAKIDDVMTILAKELGLSTTMGPFYTPDVPKDALSQHKFETVYDENGKLMTDGRTRTLDLSEGAKIRIMGGKFMGCEGEVHAINPQGQYRLHALVRVKKDFHAYTALLLGSWWVEVAVKGTLPTIPVVSV